MFGRHKDLRRYVKLVLGVGDAGQLVKSDPGVTDDRDSGEILRGNNHSPYVRSRRQDTEEKVFLLLQKP